MSRKLLEDKINIVGNKLPLKCKGECVFITLIISYYNTNNIWIYKKDLMRHFTREAKGFFFVIAAKMAIDEFI